MDWPLFMFVSVKAVNKRGTVH